MPYNKTRRRDRAANMALRQARRYGELATFTSALTGSTPVDVYAMLVNYEQVTQLRRGGETDNFELLVVVPRQTNFPPASFSPGDTLLYPKTGGTTYMIENVLPDIEGPDMAATFTMKLGRYGLTAELG